MLMSMAGGLDFTSRLFSALFGDLIKGSVLHLYIIACLGHLVLNLYAAFTTYNAQFCIVLYVAGMGFFNGQLMSAIYSSCTEALPKEYQSHLFGLFNVADGIAYHVAAISGGLIVDLTGGTYFGVYIFVAVMLFVTIVGYSTILKINKTTYGSGGGGKAEQEEIGPRVGAVYGTAE